MQGHMLSSDRQAADQINRMGYTIINQVDFDRLGQGGQVVQTQYSFPALRGNSQQAKDSPWTFYHALFAGRMEGGLLGAQREHLSKAVKDLRPQ
jgi:hypothetical protein